MVALWGPQWLEVSQLAQSAGSVSASQQLQVLVHCWKICQQLLQHVACGAGAAGAAAVHAPLLEALRQHQQNVLTLLLAAALPMPGTSGASGSPASPQLLQLLEGPDSQELLHQLAWGILSGRFSSGCLSTPPKAVHSHPGPGRGPGRGWHGAGPDMLMEPPPPPYPSHLTYDRIGQLFQLLSWLEPQWLQRAALQGAVALQLPGRPVRGAVPWLQLLWAGWWLDAARCVDVHNPPLEWSMFFPPSQVCSLAYAVEVTLTTGAHVQCARLHAYPPIHSITAITVAAAPAGLDFPKQLCTLLASPICI